MQYEPCTCGCTDCPTCGTLQGTYGGEREKRLQDHADRVIEQYEEERASLGDTGYIK